MTLHGRNITAAASLALAALAVLAALAAGTTVAARAGVKPRSIDLITALAVDGSGAVTPIAAGSHAAGPPISLAPEVQPDFIAINPKP